MHHVEIITDEGYSGLNPVQFGFEDCKRSHAFGPAVRTYWLFHFVVSGFGFFERNNQAYRIGPGEMFVIPPFEETYYEADSENPWSYIWIGFTTHSPLPIVLPDTIRCPEALKIFNNMKKCREMDNGKSAFLSGKLWELFSFFLEQESPSENYIEKALDCIHSEYMTSLTIDGLAQRLNLDRSYFSTLFKQTMGISPKQYLLNYRMNIAASLILDNKKSISVAAASVGYADIFNFSKMFKHHFGMSPTRYAETHGK